MQKFSKFILYIVLSIVITMAFSSSNVSAQTISGSTEAEINNLLHERAVLLLEDDLDDESLMAINEQLKSLGVEIYSNVEARMAYPRLFKDTSSVSTRIAKPVQDNIDWISYRVTQKRNGEKYEVQHLIAQSNRKDSNLKETGSRILKINYDWKAGSQNVLKALASTAVGEVPIVGSVVTGYDFLSTFLSGVSKKTEVNVPSITYTWASNTTVCFSFVKLASDSDDNQNLSFISTKVETSCGYQWASFTYDNNQTHTSIESDSKTFTKKAAKYASSYYAVKSFTDNSAQSLDYVDSVKLLGPKDKKIEYIYPLTPAFPAHIR